MTATLIVSKRIKLLSADIASKIAAGEVVERPAAVLKELLENSIDAGATHIDVTVEQGGIQSITVTDNGTGIVHEDLKLALQQHATSKITSAGDLASITSLGFRGEALASINSVAKLSITSQTAQQEHAWCINANGITPAAHPVGTTVYMQSLFYNVPARRKFLRSERTEYLYLEEAFKRIVLSNFAVAFTLTNHGKLVKNLPICKDQLSQTRRLINICGKQVLQQAITIDAEQNGMRLWGWLGAPADARSQEQHQYFFINQRVIKDRLINHALRQIYQPLCAEGKMPFYCLYLELDPIALDVNVHPTKHEVRFRDARIIHAFLTQILTAALGAPSNTTPTFTAPGLFTHKFAANTAVAVVEDIPRLLSVLHNKIIIAQIQEKLLLIDAVAMRKELLLLDLAQNVTPTLLELPQRISTDVILADQFFVWCQQLGLLLDPFGPDTVIVRKVPQPLCALHLQWQILLQKLYQAWQDKCAVHVCYAAIATCIDFSDLTAMMAQDLLLQLDQVKNKGVWRAYNTEELQALYS